MMHTVMLAMVPMLAAMVWLFGTGVILNVVFACLCCAVFEIVILKLRGMDSKAGLRDGSALLTGILLGAALPPLVPFWLILIAAIFAIVIAKHIYGGIGSNLFNPAMVGYAVLLVSFPAHMSSWPAPALDETSVTGLADTLSYFWSGAIAAADGTTAATPLDAMKSELGRMRTVPEVLSADWNSGFGPRGWVWINLFAALGGLFLVVRNIISWHIPAGVVAGLAIPSLLAVIGDASTNPSPWFNLVSGGTMLGVFFIATDPVSSASSPRGKLIYGAGIGFLTYAIRTWGAYPDGFAFAVLLMNMCVPLIDRYTLPMPYGREEKLS